MAVRIVPLTTAMVREVAEVHRRSFGTRLGRAYAEAFITWFVHSKTAVSIVALDDHDQPLGYGVGAADGYRAELNAALRLPAIRVLVTRPWILFDPYIVRMICGYLRHSLGRRENAPPSDMKSDSLICLVALGVSGAARGQGVGANLLRTFETEAARKGFMAMTLAVRQNNTTARRLYERYGWVANGDGDSNPQGMITYRKSACP